MSRYWMIWWLHYCTVNFSMSTAPCNWSVHYVNYLVEHDQHWYYALCNKKSSLLTSSFIGQEKKEFGYLWWLIHQSGRHPFMCGIHSIGWISCSVSIKVAQSFQNKISCVYIKKLFDCSDSCDLWWHCKLFHSVT